MSEQQDAFREAGPVTIETFTRAVGFPPSHDDLERCNCSMAGQLGHWSCGWDATEQMPVWLSTRPVRAA